MSSPQADWSQQPNAPKEGELPPADLTVPPAAFPLDKELAFTTQTPGPIPIARAAEPGDESPTIISKGQRQQVRPDETIANSLRGKCLAHFELLEPIGVGGMAAVIRARDKQLERMVALKILPPEMATDPESIRRFHQEARAAARLDHENIARVFFCGEDQGLQFIAFEFVEGHNLRVVLERRGPLPVVEAIHYMLQVATGLAHAAQRGVVHRDIKPSNIIITPNGRAKLVDMGLARSLGARSEGDLTQSGVTLGTFDYISPEQALEPRDADARSDIYSLGCTFYHVLTGQPPVPEGTAAKKLHHHQHVMPVDPRQLNPGIPDDLAAILGRMMAKDPGHRYQRPEHLVQHLLQLAQKLGGNASVPEGVLFVDAPLPGPPRTAPLAVIGLAAVVVIGFVLLLGFLPGNSTQPDPLGPTNAQARKDIRPVKGDIPSPPISPSTSKNGETPPRPKVAVAAVDVHNPRELAEALKNNISWIRLAADVFDLTAAPDGSKETNARTVTSLVFEGDKLLLEPEPGRRPIIRLAYDPSTKNDSDWVALKLAGKDVTIRNVRFVVHAAGSEAEMTSVQARLGEKEKLRFEKCEFIQSKLSGGPDRRRVTSVQLLGVGGQPEVSFTGCLFARIDEPDKLAAAPDSTGGHEAVVLNDFAKVTLWDCAFGPHAALVRLNTGKALDGEQRKPQDTPELSLLLQHSSALLNNDSSVFELGEGASAHVTVVHCLFSAPTGEVPEAGEGAVLVRQLGDQGGQVEYSSQHRNVYHNLGVFWMRGKNKKMLAADLEAMTRLAQGVSATDVALPLEDNPWQDKAPLEKLAAGSAKEAFQVNLTLPALRQPKAVMQVVGVQTCSWGKVYDKIPPLPVIEPLPRNVKIVDPTRKISGEGVYPSIAQAAGDAQPGDIIQIKHNGPLLVDPVVQLRKRSIDLTIQPYPKYRPVLEPARQDAVMFQVSDGKLTLDNLEFHLPPPRGKFAFQSVVLLQGEGQVSFKKCLTTLEQKDRDIPQALVTLADPNREMEMPEPIGPKPDGPQVRLDGCYVRGTGDLIGVRASRPFLLDIKESLVALDGSLLVVDGNMRELPIKPSAQITLNHLTAYLADHLILLRGKADAKTPPGLVHTQVVQASNCLFVSAGRMNTKALVCLDGVSEGEMKNLFSWESGQQNAYRCTQFLEMHSRVEGTMSVNYGRDQWELFAKDQDRVFATSVKFQNWPPAGERRLTEALASVFKLAQPDALGARDGTPAPGANVDLLPTPYQARDTGPQLPTEK